MLIKIISLSATIYFIQILAYFMEKRFGEKHGTFFSAFFQGMLSSTALTLSNAQKSIHQKSHFHYHVLLMSSLTAILASLIELLVIIWFNNTILGQRLLVLVPIYLILLGVIAYHRYHLKDFKEQESKKIDFPKISEALKLAVLLAGFIFLASLLKDQIGPSGPLLVSFIGGLFETHGVALAQVTLVDQGVLTLDEAYHHIMVSVMAGFISKLGITFFLVRNKYSYTLALTYIILAITTLGLWFYF